jgi:hypothetical protein
MPLAAAADARAIPDSLCPAAIDEERRELEELRLGVDLGRSNVAAFEKIYELVEGLWKADATDRMTWIRAKYDRDAARLALEEADWIVRRQEALLEQYRIACDSAGGAAPTKEARQAAARAYRHYREAHCGALGKAVEVAATKLAFDREWLASILDLRAGNVATVQDVILAELEVEREEKRLKDARSRAGECAEEKNPTTPGEEERSE